MQILQCLHSQYLLCFQHEKLSMVRSCMNITMKLGGVDCHAQILENEITCRIPKDLTIPAEGVPVWVRYLITLAVSQI